MASDQEFMDYVSEQLRGVPRVSHRKMFGEYAVYVGEKVVALVCDNQLFVKPTAAGRALLESHGALREASPFPVAKPMFLIEGQLDDTDFMARLIATTERELPLSKPKKVKASKSEKPTPKTKSSPKAKKPAAKK